MAKKVWSFYYPTAQGGKQVPADVVDTKIPAGMTINGLKVLAKTRTGSKNSRYMLDYYGKQAFAVVPNDWFTQETAWVFQSPAPVPRINAGSSLQYVSSLDQLYFWMLSTRMSANACDSLSKGESELESIRKAVANVLDTWGIATPTWEQYQEAHKAFIDGCQLNQI